jgi:glutamate:GABA antiporter
MKAIQMASARSGVGGLVSIVAVLVIVGHIGKVGAWTATGARLPFVAGVGGRLPDTFGRLHPRWKTPHIALYFQAAIVALLTVIGQAGTDPKGAYEVYFSMTLIPTFIPFLFLFASAIRIRRETSNPQSLAFFAAMGFLTTLAALVLAVIPSPNEKYQLIYVTKVIGLAIILIGVGTLIYFFPIKRRKS